MAIHLSDKSGDSRLPQLVGLVGILEGREVILKNRVVTVGRDGSMCDIVLDHALISRKHALFESDERGQVTITDLDSKQGTFVNGERIKSRELSDGDCVGFGRAGMISFRFRCQTTSHRMAAPASGSGSIASNTPERFSVDEIKSRLRAAAETASRAPIMPSASSVIVDSGSQSSTPVAGPVQRIGRAPDNDIVLDSPAVSRHHATIRFDSAAPVIADSSSTNGTYVNGQPVRAPRALGAKDLVFIGGFLLRVDGRRIAKHDLGSSRLIAAGIGQDLAGRKILRDISFAIFPREFIGLMGPSGCGKSTLMDALNGLRPATEGAVFVDDLDLYRNFDAVRRSIGYVPQRDVLHDALTVERTLQYAAQLRLPARTTRDALRVIIDDVIKVVGLQEHRQSTFQQLSGGQQKRLSLALELLTKPNFLFLDEPTSPLDPETSENLMLLFRRLANEGRIVVMVTHKFEQFDQMHNVALLTKGGRLAFFGPPQEALRFFGCREPGHIYREVAAKDPEEVSKNFRASAQYQAFVASRLTESQQIISAVQKFAGGMNTYSRTPRSRAGIRQWLILTRRYLEIKLKDRRNTLLLIVQAPMIALILALIAGDTVNDAKTLFIAAVIAIWFGANNAIREVVAEASIYQRERLVNLKIPSYLFSKFAVLALIAIVQCALFAGILVLLHRLRLEDLDTLLPTLCLTAFGGIGLGLLFSSFVSSTEKAMSVLPLLLIPQLLLSGFLKPIDNVYFNGRTGAPVSSREYDAFEATKTASAGGSRTSVPTDPISRIAGLGVGAYAADLMIARWAVDALVHGVGQRDREAREKLAAQMFVAEYEKVKSGSSEGAVSDAYLSRVWMDWAVLVLAVGLCLSLAAWALRAKDSL